MFTIRKGKLACVGVLGLLSAACSHEQQDWRAAEAADSIEAYDQFIKHHPESELVTEARTRVAQLGEERDWHEAGTVDTVDAYRQFLTQHPNGKWAQEARIRIESFTLDGSPAGGTTVPQADSTALASQGPKSPASQGQKSSAPSAPLQGGASVQLGAFNTEAGARKEWQVLQGRFSAQLKGLTPHIVTAQTSSGRLYRLQAAVGGESSAHALCDALKGRGQGCITVLQR